MREILFRGKNKDGKWFCGDLLRPNIIITNWDKFTADRRFRADYGVVETKTIGQYTGYDDKNGKGIFQGDLVTDSLFHRFMIVVFRHGAFMFKAIKKTNFEYAPIWEWFGIDGKHPDAEIIGNIFDNQELIMEADDHA